VCPCQGVPPLFALGVPSDFGFPVVASCNYYRQHPSRHAHNRHKFHGILQRAGSGRRPTIAQSTGPFRSCSSQVWKDVIVLTNDHRCLAASRCGAITLPLIASECYAVHVNANDIGWDTRRNSLCSTEQHVNNGFDMNHSCIEKLDLWSARTAQEQREFCACQD
jgi:hypothetical protein